MSAILDIWSVCGVRGGHLGFSGLVVASAFCGKLRSNLSLCIRVGLHGVNSASCNEKNVPKKSPFISCARAAYEVIGSRDIGYIARQLIEPPELTIEVSNTHAAHCVVKRVSE